jgi:hypothetical protein
MQFRCACVVSRKEALAKHKKEVQGAEKNKTPVPPAPECSKNGVLFTDASYECKFAITCAYSTEASAFEVPPGAACFGEHTCSSKVNAMSNNKNLGHSATVVTHLGAAAVAAHLVLKGGNVLASSRTAMAASTTSAPASRSILYRTSRSAKSDLVGDITEYTYV